MDYHTLFILIVILFAYFYDFINGFHDASNSIATIIATGILTPRQAVLWAAIFNFIAILFCNLMVAKTIGNGFIDSHLVDAKLIFSALVGAISWNLLTWYWGLPSSSSHALIGGLAGAAFMRGGVSALQPVGFVKVLLGIVAAPLLGFVMGLLLIYLMQLYFGKEGTKTERPTSARTFNILQLASSALLSITHGANDAQKTMGIITVLLFSASWLQGDFHVPFWVVLSCQATISLGTLAGGWRIVNTMATKITHLNAKRGSAAEAGAAAVIFLATAAGVPVSTTQVVTGSIAGVGVMGHFVASNWQVLRRILVTWFFTIPAAAAVSVLIAWLL